MNGLSREMPPESLAARATVHAAAKHFVRIVAALAVVFFLVKADIYLFVTGLLPVAPSTLFFLLSLPLIYCTAIRSLHEGRLPPAVHGSMRVLLPFTVLVAFSLVGILVRYPHIPEDMRPLFFPFLNLYVFFIGILLGGIRIERSVWKAALVAGLLVTIVTIAIDVFLPHTFTLQELEGPSGLAQNPNGGAYIALLLMVCAVDWERPSLGLKNLLVIGLAFFGIFLTASRSGILAAAVVGLVYFLRVSSSVRLARKIKVAAVCALLLALIVSAFAYVVESGPASESEPSKVSRLLSMDAEILRFGDIASLERVDAVDRSLRIIEEKTALGMGTGYVYSMPVGPHNMYLARWVDNGLVGLLSYLWLLLAAFLVNRKNRNAEGMAIALVFFFFGLFSHNVLEDRTILLLLAMSTARGAVSINESGPSSP